MRLLDGSLIEMSERSGLSVTKEWRGVTIHLNGGQVIVQDEGTSVVWGMPGYVASAGLADKVLPLQQLGNEIVRRVRWGRALPLSVPYPAAGSLGSKE